MPSAHISTNSTISIKKFHSVWVILRHVSTFQRPQRERKRNGAKKKIEKENQQQQITPTTNFATPPPSPSFEDTHRASLGFFLHVNFVATFSKPTRFDVVIAFFRYFHSKDAKISNWNWSTSTATTTFGIHLLNIITIQPILDEKNVYIKWNTVQCISHMVSLFCALLCNVTSLMEIEWQGRIIHLNKKEHKKKEKLTREKCVCSSLSVHTLMLFNHQQQQQQQQQQKHMVWYGC